MAEPKRHGWQPPPRCALIASPKRQKPPISSEISSHSLRPSVPILLKPRRLATSLLVPCASITDDSPNCTAVIDAARVCESLQNCLAPQLKKKKKKLRDCRDRSQQTRTTALFSEGSAIRVAGTTCRRFTTVLRGITLYMYCCFRHYNVFQAGAWYLEPSHQWRLSPLRIGLIIVRGMRQLHHELWHP